MRYVCVHALYTVLCVCMSVQMLGACLCMEVHLTPTLEGCMVVDLELKHLGAGEWCYINLLYSY